MIDHMTTPALAAIAGVCATVAGSIAAVDLQIDGAFVAAVCGGVVALAGGVARIWRASVQQTAQIRHLESEVRTLRTESSDRARLIDQQERTIAQLSSTIEVLRIELTRHERHNP